MTDSFDEELREAFAAQEQELAGWEFSPAMQQQVLQRVATETPAAERRRRPYIPRAVLWVGAAAATLLVAVNLVNFVPMAGSQKPSVGPSTASAPRQGTAKEAVPTAAPQTSASHGTPGAAADNAVPLSATTAAQAPTAPQSSMKMAQSNQVVLALPSAPTPTNEPARSAPRFLGLAVASALRLAYAPVTGLTIQLNNSGLTAMDAENQTVWQQTLSGLDATALLAVSPDGQSAVSAGARVYLVGADGAAKNQIELADSAQALAWSADDRLAVLHGSKMTVYRSGKAAYELPADSGASIAFAPDGRLAALNGSSLRLYGADGSKLAESSVERNSGSIRFIDGGNVVLADANNVWAVNPVDGKTLWRARYEGAEGLSQVVVSPDGTRIAVFTAASSTPALWVLDQTGAQLHAELLQTLPDAAVFAGNTQLQFAIGGTLQLHPVTP